MTKGRNYSPGLKKITKKNGKIFWYWDATRCARDIRGFTPKLVRLHHDNHADRAAYCLKMKAELNDWLDNRPMLPEDHYDGTFTGLSRMYQVHPQSPYQSLQQSTQRDYQYGLGMIERFIGKRYIDKVTGIDCRRWFNTLKEPKQPGGKELLTKAKKFITTLRLLMKFGASCGFSECRDLSMILSDMRFESPSGREEFITLQQVMAVIEMAHEMGRPSIALGQALQYELTMRQWQVTGQWEDLNGRPPISGITYRGREWVKGLKWNDIDRSLILSIRTSKTGAPGIYDLTRYDLIMRELERIPLDKRIGPMIIDESTGLPYQQGRYSRVWRKVANAAGVPNDIWNRDTRAGGITEASQVATAQETSRHATHSDIQTTNRYVRDTLDVTRSVADKRMAKRREQNEE